MYEELIAEFEKEMYRLYLVPWKSWGYRAERFRQMIEKPKPGRSGKNYIGSIQAAKLNSQAGLKRACELKSKSRIDLAVEHLVLLEKYMPLFSKEDRQLARLRLALIQRSSSTQGTLPAI